MCTKLKSQGSSVSPGQRLMVKTSRGYRSLRWGIPVKGKLVVNARSEELSKWRGDEGTIVVQGYWEKEHFFPANRLRVLATKDSFAIVTEETTGIHHRKPQAA